MMKFKKLTAVLVAAVLCISMSATAFAANPIKESPGTDSKTVTGSYDSSGETKIYKVDINWGSMEFTYKANSSKGTWDPETHTYSGEETVTGWVANKEGADEFTITNHSNTSIKVNQTFSASTMFSEVKGTVGYANYSITNAAAGESLGDVTKAPSHTSKLTLSGVPSKFDGTQTIGTINITIN